MSLGCASLSISLLVTSTVLTFIGLDIETLSTHLRTAAAALCIAIVSGDHATDVHRKLSAR